jgi:hypothetical protein
MLLLAKDMQPTRHGTTPYSRGDQSLAFSSFAAELASSLRITFPVPFSSPKKITSTVRSSLPHIISIL